MLDADIRIQLSNIVIDIKRIWKISFCFFSKIFAVTLIQFSYCTDFL